MFIKKKKESKDKMLRFIMRYKKIVEYFVEYDEAIGHGDPIGVKLLYPYLLPLFAAFNKDNYSDLVASIT